MKQPPNILEVANALLTLDMTDQQVETAGGMTKQQAIAILRRVPITIPDTLRHDASDCRSVTGPVSPRRT